MNTAMHIHCPTQYTPAAQTDRAVITLNGTYSSIVVNSTAHTLQGVLVLRWLVSVFHQLRSRSSRCRWRRRASGAAGLRSQKRYSCRLSHSVALGLHPALPLHEPARPAARVRDVLEPCAPSFSRQNRTRAS
jgi:hypothetical protein